MNSNLIYAFSSLAIAIYTFYFWRKYKNRELLWLTWFGVAGFLIDMVDYYLFISGASQAVLSDVGYSIKIFDVIVVVAMIFIAIKYYSRKHK